jgi:hypothetical protein
MFNLSWPLVLLTVAMFLAGAVVGDALRAGTGSDSPATNSVYVEASP